MGRVLPLCPSDFPDADDFWVFLGLFVEAWPRPPRHPTGPAHLVATSKARDRFVCPANPPSPSPTSVPSDQFLFFFFYVFVHFTVKAEILTEDLAT